MAQEFADRIKEGGLNIISEICYRETPSDRPILLILNSPQRERVPDSGTAQEREFKTLLMIRASIAGRLLEDSIEVRILYAARFLSLPDMGKAVVDGSTKDYQRIPIV